MAQERYLLGLSEEGEPFGADRDRPHLVMLLRAGKAGLRADLAARYFAETGAVAGGQAQARPQRLRQAGLRRAGEDHEMARHRP